MYISPYADNDTLNRRRSRVPVAGQDSISLPAILHPVRCDPPDADGVTVSDPTGPAVVAACDVNPGAERTESKVRHTLPAVLSANTTVQLELRSSESAVYFYFY